MPTTQTNRKPGVGDRVRVTGVWSNKRINVTGIVMPSPRNKYRPQYQTEKGHWRAKIRTDSGVEFEIPWTTKIMTFETLYQKGA